MANETLTANQQSTACLSCGARLLKDPKPFMMIPDAGDPYCPNPDCPRFGLVTVLAKPYNKNNDPFKEEE